MTKRRKKSKIEKNQVEPLVASVTSVLPDIEASPAPKPEKKPEKKKPKTVKVFVTVGTLQFEQGIYEKGTKIEVSPEQLKRFDPHDIKVIG